ncbi:MAG: 50S ribosomal protein L9 [Candidatus Cloacimonetes bacterium]|jgi:large subunit ribosomal protein L9|nr:50S ribosomal protein L9 [Candidatus Cloacimonadota bacterium]
MKVILLDTIEKLGNAGDVVNVKSGYARNYLVPRKLALYATPANMKRLTVIQENLKAEEEKKVAALKVLAEKIASTKLVFVRKIDEQGSMFGSVSEHDLANALKEEGVDVHRSAIALERHVKTLGEHTVEVKLHREVLANLSFIVKAENAEEFAVEVPAEPAVELEAEPEIEPIVEPEIPETEDAVEEEIEQETQPTEEPAAEIE